jgi:hypothetical protein
MRQLTTEERALIKQFADLLKPQAQRKLLDDLKNAVVFASESNGSRITFEIANYVRPQYRGQHLFDAEGTMSDQDGTELSVLLYADENGRLFELEFIRWDSSNVLAPRWETLAIHGTCSLDEAQRNPGQ